LCGLQDGFECRARKFGHGVELFGARVDGLRVNLFVAVMILPVGEFDDAGHGVGSALREAALIAGAQELRAQVNPSGHDATFRWGQCGLEKPSVAIAAGKESGCEHGYGSRQMMGGVVLVTGAIEGASLSQLGPVQSASRLVEQEEDSKTARTPDQKSTKAGR